MSTEPRTVEEWLAYGDDLPLKLAEVFTLGPHSHDFYGGKDEPSEKCLKCNLDEDTVECFCSVPDPITIDWSTAMKWFRNGCDDHPEEVMEAVVSVFLHGIDDGCGNADRAVSFGKRKLEVDAIAWFVFYAQPKDYLRAAAMAVERSKR